MYIVGYPLHDLHELGRLNYSLSISKYQCLCTKGYFTLDLKGLRGPKTFEWMEKLHTCNST